MPDEKAMPLNTTIRNLPRRSSWQRWLILAGVVVAFAAFYAMFGGELTLAKLAARETELRNLIQQHPVESCLAGYGIYAIATGLSIPGATVLTLVYGWLFGFWRGLILVSLASTTGATLAFLLSRYLLRDLIQQRFGDRLQKFNAALERDGAFYLFTLRLVPAVPFFVINVVMGLTPIKTTTYWWVSQLGMLPATAVYVSAGANVPDLTTLADRGVGGIVTLPMILSLIALGIFPLAVKWLMQWLAPKQAARE